MRIDAKEIANAYYAYRQANGMPELDPADIPKLESELRRSVGNMEINLVAELPDGSIAPMGKVQLAQEPSVADDQGGDLRFHLGEDQVYCADRGRWIKHDNPEWIARRKAFEHQKEEPIITVAKAFKNAGMKDLTPDQIKEMVETKVESPTEEMLKGILTAGDWTKWGKTIEDMKKVTAIDDTVLVAETDPNECKRCNCYYLAEGCEPYDHGFCGECACKELEEIHEQLSTKMSNIDEQGDEFKHFLDEERLAVIQTAWYNMRDDSERQHHGWMVRMNETVNDRNEQLKELTKSRYKFIKEISELKRGVVYVALMKRIDELETELLEYQNLRDRMIDDKEQVRTETQGALQEAGKQIDSLTAANRAQGKHYREQQKLLSDRLARRDKALVAAGVQVDEEGEEVAVYMKADPIDDAEYRFAKRRIEELEALIKFGQPCTHVFQRNPSSPRGEWCSGCGAHVKHHLHDEGPNRCPDNAQLKGMIRTPGYSPVNEDPTIGPDLKPHDKMDREQLLAEVKRLEVLPCKAACKKCGEVSQLSVAWWGRDFVCPSCRQ